jgi:hypothetical protein
MKKIIWRLSTRPTTEEVVKLLSCGVITKEESREILFTSVEEEERDKKSLESEIKFLRDLVEKLSKGSHDRIIETIREIRVPYYNQPWYQPYHVWCNSGGGVVTTGTIGGGSIMGGGVTNALYSVSNSTGANTVVSGFTSTDSGRPRFSGIKTF